MRMTKQRALAAAVALTLSGTAHAVYAEDTQAQKEGYETAPVVVTASGFEEDVRFAPASISVIKADEIAQRGYTDLRQVLDMVEGVDTFGATGRFDTPAVSIRGMDDGYTLLLVDGVAQVGPGIAGGMMRSFNQLANTSLPTPSQIERVEVVRGPMSTLYGSDAMGGVINIITKKVTDEFHGSVSVGSILETTDDKSNTMKYNFNVAGPITRDKVGMQMRGSYLKRGPSAFGVDKEKRDYDNWNLGTRVTYTPTAGHSYYLDIDRGQNMRDGDFAQRGKMKPPPPAPPHAEVETKLDGDVAQRFDRMKIVLGAENKVGKEGTWTNTLSFLRNEMHLDADMTGTAKPNILPLRIPIRSQIRNNVKNDFVTFDTKYVTPLGDDHTLAVGARWQREGVDYHLMRQMSPISLSMLPPLQQAMFRNMMRQRSSNDNGSLSRSSWALYGEDTWALTKKLVFTYGLRYDHPEDYDDNLSPRGYLIYMPNRNFTVKGGVATGYKAPTMLQSAPVDIHLNITGEIYRGNTGLKPEKSTTEEIGFYYHNEHDTDAHLTFFHTDFQNKIDLSDAVGGVRTYENVGKARIHGVEVGTKFAIAPKVSAGLNWTLLTSQIKSGKNVGQPLRSTPKQAVNLRLDWMPTDATDVWLSAQYRSGMYRSRQVTGLSSTYHPFTVLNMGVTHKLRDGLSVQFAVNNLLNRNFDQTSMAADGMKYGDYYDEIDADGIAGGSYISRRSYWLGLTYDF